MKHIESGKYNNLYGNWKIGEGTRIGSFCDLGGEIGKNCKVQSHSFIPPGVEIGDNVFIGPHAVFTNNKVPDLKIKDWKREKTVVGEWAVIGAGAVILPGITIGKGALIGAGAVVTKDVPPYEVWVGNPARFLKSNCPLGKQRCDHCGHCL